MKKETEDPGSQDSSPKEEKDFKDNSRATDVERNQI